MKFAIYALLISLSAVAWGYEDEELSTLKEKSTKTSENEKVGSETVTREKIRAIKSKNQKTVDELEDTEDELEEE